MIYEAKGNLLNSKCQFICHQVNCQGKMGSGIALSIKNKWPIVYEQYIKHYENKENEILQLCGSWEITPEVSEILLGDSQIIPVSSDKNVINMFAQQYYGYDGRRYTSYDAFWDCLEKIRKTVPKGSTIGFPKNIGCCRGGANWEVIKKMIIEALAYDYEVYIFEYNGG